MYLALTVPILRISWRLFTSRGGYGPASISTDEYGLATNADKKNPALPWSDIVGGYYCGRGLAMMMLYSLSEGPLYFDLNGYSPAAREELWSIIRERAGLSAPRHPRPLLPLSQVWSRPDYRIRIFGRPQKVTPSLAAAESQSLHLPDSSLR